MTKRSKVITLIQKKGILTLLFIILSESITLSNAVQFWSTYQNWSNKHGRGRFANPNNINNNSNEEYNGKFCTNENGGQCSAKPSSKAPLDDVVKLATSLPSKLHPRQNARAASTTGKRSCSNAMYNCCKESCPSCIKLDIRGGASTAETVAETIASAATTAAAAGATEALTNTGVPTPYNLPLNMWKVIFQIFLTALNVACWLIPLRAKKISENKFALGIANAFSGGVFLTLAFGHLIPECVHGFEGMNEALPYMIVLGGYLLIFFVEKVAFDAHGLLEVGDDEGPNKVGNGKNGGDALQQEQANNVGRSAVILLGALAVHSILEMTALGLANTFGDSALLSLSIALHQVSALLLLFLLSLLMKSFFMFSL